MEQNEKAAKDYFAEEKNVMSPELARKEVDNWLDIKGVKDRRIKENEDTVDTLCEAVEDGDLYFRDGKLVQKLNQPIGNEGVIKELTYENRIKLSEVRNRLKGVKSTDLDGRMLAYVGSAVNKPIKMLENIDTADWSLAQSIVVFFM